MKNEGRTKKTEKSERICVALKWLCNFENTYETGVMYTSFCNL